MFEQLLVGIKISVHCEENLHLEYIKSHEFLHHREEKCVTLNRECVSVVNCTPENRSKHKKRFFVNYSHILIVANISFITKYLKYQPILLLINRIKFKVGKSSNISGYICGCLEFF